MEELLFTKASDYRDAKYNLKTEIISIDCIKYVRKVPMTSVAKAHIDNILGYERKLKEIFEPEFEVTSLESCNDGLMYKFAEGQSLESILDDSSCIDDGYNRALSIIDEYHNMVFKMYSGTGLNIDKRFEEIFGNQHFDSDIEVGNFVDIDLILSNIIASEKRTIIDYEWCMDFQVPLKYVFWKGLFTSIAFSRFPDDLKSKVYEKYGLTEELRNIFLDMEENFVNYAKGNTLSFNMESQNIYPSIFGINNLEWDGKNYPLTIWGRIGDTANLFGRAISYAGYNSFKFDIKGRYDRIEIFIAPVVSIISDIKVYGYREGVHEECAFTTTSEADSMEPRFFLKNTPVVIVNNNNYDSLEISFKACVWNSNELTGETFDRYLNSINYTCNRAVQELEQKNTLLQEKEAVEARLTQKSVIKAVVELLKFRKQVIRH